MAVMHPEILDSEYTESEAEVFVYEELRRQLDDSFHVFHSITWTGDRNIRGECDFVIFSLDRGFVTLEVKGGRIETVDNVWYSTTRSGERFRIKDPIKQARYAQWAFRDLYRNHFKEYFSGIFTWAVCFPEVSFSEKHHHKDLNRYNVLHAGNMGRIRGWVEELFRYTRPRQQEGGLSRREADNFLSLFNVSMKLPRSILFALHKQQEELENINRFQDYLLDLFDDKKRVGFQGAAGTGKSWIAIKKAIRLAEKGERVLFLCFSNNLEEYIRGRLGNFPGIRVVTFHSYALSVLADAISLLAQEEGAALQRFVSDVFRRVHRRRNDPFNVEEFEPDPRGVKKLLRGMTEILDDIDFTTLIEHYRSQQLLGEELLSLMENLLPCRVCGEEGLNGMFYSERLPRALLQVFEEYTLRDQYDAIIIDEAQDFEENWCDCITFFFKSPEERTIYVFYDDNQSIFRNIEELPVVRLIAHQGLGNYIFHLRRNLRNTQEIHDYAVRATGHGSTAQAMEIQGLEPEELDLGSPEEVRRQVGDLLRELVDLHGLSTSAITVLCNVPLRDSPFGHFPRIGGFALQPEGAAKGGRSLAFRTISQFKGLETDIAIVVLDHSAPVKEPQHRITPELKYVAFTRAKHLLYVVRLQ